MSGWLGTMNYSVITANKLDNFLNRWKHSTRFRQVSVFPYAQRIYRARIVSGGRAVFFLLEVIKGWYAAFAA